ncbi:MAG: hypothetical protein WCL23_01865 [Candidatus Moraniibacteriota bacterium]
MKQFLFGVAFASLFTMAGVALAGTVTSGNSFEDVWTAITGTQSEISATRSDLNTLKLELATKAVQDALEQKAIEDELAALKKTRTVSISDSGIAHSEHYVLGDASFQGIR